MPRLLTLLIWPIALLGVWIGASGTASLAHASDAAAPSAVARTILAFYDGAAEREAGLTRIHAFAEMPLNHLGYFVEYHDVRDALPADAGRPEVAGMLSWFSGPLSVSPIARRGYFTFAAGLARSGKKLVILGETGGEFWTPELKAINQLLGSIGLRHKGRSIGLTFAASVISADNIIGTFESKLDPVLPAFPMIAATAKDVTPLLEIKEPARDGTATSTVAALSPGGGFVASGYEIKSEPGLGRSRWLIDPFRFFSAAYDLDNWPRPDTTTLDGRRLYFSHADADGLGELLGADAKVRLPSVFFNNVVKAYPDLPVTFSVTTGDLDPEIGGNPGLKKFVKEIWASPNVEPAIHSHTRPMQWSFFERYDRALEETHTAARGWTWWTDLLAFFGLAKPSSEFDLTRYIARDAGAPRSYMLHPFSMEGEITAALAAASELTPAATPIKLFTWTGDELPFEQALATLHRRGLLDINGGGSRFDSVYPSAGYVTPLSRPAGRERQTYAVASSDFAGATANEALKAVQSTIEKTGLPRRLAPFSLRYHLSALQSKDVVRTLAHYFDEASAAAVHPVSTASYAAIVRDFFAVRIEREADGQFRLSNLGSMRTFRFDNAAALSIDLAKSTGVLGQSRNNGSLYVAIDPAVTSALLVVSSSRPEPEISLTASRWNVRALKRADGEWSFAADGFGRGDFVWSNVPPGEFDIIARRAGKVAWSGVAATGLSGDLKLSVPISAIEPLQIEVRCRTGLCKGGRS